MSTSLLLSEITERNDAATRIVMGFAADMPILADVWRMLSAALADTQAVASEVTRLADELRATRLDRANLLAAIRAALTAQHDGEPDPLYYLRDELDARALGARARRP